MRSPGVSDSSQVGSAIGLGSAWRATAGRPIQVNVRRVKCEHTEETRETAGAGNGRCQPLYRLPRIRLWEKKPILENSTSVLDVRIDALLRQHWAAANLCS